MADSERSVEILVVGAGMAGLAAASELQRAGHAVLVVDEGHDVGGRLASRRIGLATFDYGAQFMTARDPRFAAAVEQWAAAGVAEEWYRSSPGGHPRWRGKPTMTAVAHHLARPLDLLLARRVIRIRRHAAGWLVELESGETILAGAVLLTAPTPQALALLDAGQVGLTSALRARLERIAYECCLAVMATLAGPTRLPPPGWLAPAEGPVAWIADNQLKGVSAAPAVTIHATAAFSLQHWDHDRQMSGQKLLEAARPWLGSDVVEFQVHGWRYSKPCQSEQDLCLVLNRQPPLLIAGDACGGPRVEGAALSGWAAADLLKQMAVPSS